MTPASAPELVFIFALAMWLGVELITRVPATLHTPLMSGSNAISGITIVGALLVAGTAEPSPLTTVIGTLAVAAATVNVVGGYLVTDRMLGMFERRPAPETRDAGKPGNPGVAPNPTGTPGNRP